MELFVEVEKEASEILEYVPLEKATHLISFEDEYSIKIDGMDFSEVKNLLSEGYRPCIAKNTNKVVIEMGESTAKQLMFVLGHFNSANSSVFHPLVDSESILVDGETLYEKMAQVLGDIFESEEELPYKLEVIKSTFGDPVLSLKVV